MNSCIVSAKEVHSGKIVYAKLGRDHNGDRELVWGDTSKTALSPYYDKKEATKIEIWSAIGMIDRLFRRRDLWIESPSIEFIVNKR